MSGSELKTQATGSGAGLKTIRNEIVGKATLRVVDTGGHYVGLLISDGKQKARVDGEDPDEVWQDLRSQLGRASDAYFGYDGARSRFRHFFPDGFQSQAFEDSERQYKLDAKTKLDEKVPLERALTETGHGEAILSVFRATNLLSPFEKTRLQPLLRGPHADRFVQAAARFALGDIGPALRDMQDLLTQDDNAKWTVVTYLPFLWRPEEHMFLKPVVTRDFAERVGHPFALDYDPALKPNVYSSLLDLVKATRQEVHDLEPRDNIDLQSFIWVVGEYSGSEP